jgi:hypothetical protein
MEYYQIKKEQQPYLGVKLFRFELNNPYVTQVVLYNGQEKKGKGHYVGVYLITRESFLANYLGYSVDRCTKAKFDKSFKNIVQKLK